MSEPSRAPLVPGLIGLAVGTNTIYYQELHDAASAADPLHTANTLMFTIDFAAVSRGIRAGDLEVLQASLLDAATRLSSAGADFIAIASNTGHVAARLITDTTGLPVLDIRDVVAGRLRQMRVSRCGILCTSATRAQRLYDQVLEASGIEVLYPDEDMATRIDAAIFDELVHGIDDGRAAATLSEAAAQLREDGVGAVVLACTDMTIVAAQIVGDDVIDSTLLHARAAGVLAVGGDWAQFG